MIAVLRFVVRAPVVLVFALAAVAVFPGSAFACSPKDPQGRGQLDTCRQAFRVSCPTQALQEQGGFAIENIPAGAVGLKRQLSFAKPCPNATETESFEPAATSKNPDNTLPSPGRHEQAARIIFTWTGTGPSKGGMTTATYSVEFEEKVVPLKAEVIPFSSRHGERISSVRKRHELSYYAQIENPNDDPVEGRFGVALTAGQGSKRTGNFVITSVSPTHMGPCRVSQAAPQIAKVDCNFELAAGDGAFIYVSGYWQHAGKGDCSSHAFFSNQISDGQKVDSNDAKNTLSVTSTRR